METTNEVQIRCAGPFFFPYPVLLVVLMKHQGRFYKLFYLSLPVSYVTAQVVIPEGWQIPVRHFVIPTFILLTTARVQDHAARSYSNRLLIARRAINTLTQSVNHDKGTIESMSPVGCF